MRKSNSTQRFNDKDELKMQLQLVPPCRVPRVGDIHRIETSTSTSTVTVRRRRRRNAVTTAMRAVVQRVASASVEVEGRIVSKIGPGLLVLVGIHDSDSDADADYMSSPSHYPLSIQVQLLISHYSSYFTFLTDAERS